MQISYFSEWPKNLFQSTKFISYINELKDVTFILHFFKIFIKEWIQFDNNLVNIQSKRIKINIDYVFTDQINVMPDEIIMTHVDTKVYTQIHTTEIIYSFLRNNFQNKNLYK